MWIILSENTIESWRIWRRYHVLPAAFLRGRGTADTGIYCVRRGCASWFRRCRGWRRNVWHSCIKDNILFHGGIDTQGLLPYGKPEEVRAEVRKFIDLLGKDGGYMLMASQGFEGDVPIENIEAVYMTDRSI